MREAVETKVRPYTEDEKRIVIPGDNEDERTRYERRAATHRIDVERYDAATISHPDMADHFQRLKELSAAALAGWARVYGIAAETTPPVPVDGGIPTGVVVPDAYWNPTDSTMEPSGAII